MDTEQFILEILLILMIASAVIVIIYKAAEFIVGSII